MKKFISFVLVAGMLMSTACNSANEPAATTTATETTEAAETTKAETTETEATEATEEVTETSEEIFEESYYPVTIIDQKGREVVIESEPQRIVSGYYISSSLLIALELDDRMVGIEAKADKRPIYSLSAPELIDLPSVGSAKEFDLEACLAAEPDLVILPAKLSDTADTISELGIPVILVKPEDADLFIEMADIIATATNTKEKEAILTGYILETRNLLEENLPDDNSYTVYLAGNSDFLSTASNGMYQTDMITLAGGTNVASEIEDNYWVEVSYEQVLAWNPDYIILASDAEYTVEDVLNDENLSTLNAVVNGNVYQLPDDAEAWDSPVPGSILASVWVANVMYPDNISDDICNETIEEFYETFYGFSYSSISAQ